MVSGQYNPRMPARFFKVIALFVLAAAAVGYAAQVTGSWPPGLQKVPDDSPPLTPAEASRSSTCLRDIASSSWRASR